MNFHKDDYDGFTVYMIPSRTDNYTFVIKSSSANFLVDCADFEKLKEFLALEKLEIHYALFTHHHPDHIDGLKQICDLPSLKSAFCSQVDLKRSYIVGPPIKGLCSEGQTEQLSLGGLDFQVAFVPGHTQGHIAYYLPQSGVLFSGDTLFSLGCGRIFDGSLESLHRTLEDLKLKYPPETQVYCSHEYTATNLEFREKVCGLKDIMLRKMVEKRLKTEGRSVPTSLAFEALYNPFLNCSSFLRFSELRQARTKF